MHEDVFCNRILSCEEHKVLLAEIEKKLPLWQKDAFTISRIEEVSCCYCWLRTSCCVCGEYFKLGPYSEAILQMVIFHILAKRYRSKITGQKNDEKKVFKNAKEVHKMLENVHEEKKVFLKVHEVVDSANEKLATFMFLIPTEIYVNILKYFVTTSDALEEPANSFWEFTRTNREISEIVHKCLECTSGNVEKK